jgi:nitrate/nitrite transporter NarK
VGVIQHKRFCRFSDAALGSVLLFCDAIGSLTALLVAGVIIDKFGSRNITMLAMIFYIIAPLWNAKTPIAILPYYIWF